jgi:hypothetical protein
MLPQYRLFAPGYAGMNLQGRGCNERNARIHCGESDMETTPTPEQLVYHAKESGYEIRVACAPNTGCCVHCACGDEDVDYSGSFI